MGFSLKQRPITCSTDEIFDVEWTKEKKNLIRKEYRDFFRRLPHKTRSELGQLINDGR